MKPEASVVGVRELRTHLSAYLRKVGSGARIVIGSRGRRPIAQLVPVEPVPSEATIGRLVARGVARRGVGKPGTIPKVRPKRLRRTIAQLVVEDRR